MFPERKYIARYIYKIGDTNTDILDKLLRNILRCLSSQENYS